MNPSQDEMTIKLNSIELTPDQEQEDGTKGEKRTEDSDQMEVEGDGKKDDTDDQLLEELEGWTIEEVSARRELSDEELRQHSEDVEANQEELWMGLTPQGYRRPLTKKEEEEHQIMTESNHPSLWQDLTARGHRVPLNSRERRQHRRMVRENRPEKWVNLRPEASGSEEEDRPNRDRRSVREAKGGLRVTIRRSQDTSLMKAEEAREDVGVLMRTGLPLDEVLSSIPSFDGSGPLRPFLRAVERRARTMGWTPSATALSMRLKMVGKAGSMLTTMVQDGMPINCPVFLRKVLEKRYLNNDMKTDERKRRWDQQEKTCFACKKVGHFIKDCRYYQAGGSRREPSHLWGSTTTGRAPQVSQPHRFGSTQTRSRSPEKTLNVYLN